MKKGRPQDQKLRLKLFMENQIISNLPNNGYVTSPVSRQPLPPWRWLDLQVSGAAFRSCFVPTGVASGVERRGRFEPAFGEKPCLWWHLMAPYGIFSKKHYRASCTAEIRRPDNVCGWCGIAWSCSKCSKVSAITAPGFVWCHLTGFDVLLCFCFWCTPLLMISRCVTPSQVSESQKCWAVSSTHPIINCTQASLGQNTKWNCTVVITPTN